MLKNKINTVVNNIIEECYNIQILKRGKKDEEMNKIIDEAVDAYNDLLGRVNAAKSISDNSQLKKHYEAINHDLEKVSLNIMGKINKIN